MSSARIEHHVCSIGRIKEGWARRYRALGVEPFSLGHTGNGSWLRTLRRLTGAIRRLRIDVVHAHFPLAGAYSAVATSVLRVPFVFTMHGNRRPLTMRRIKNRVLDEVSLLSATGLIAVSDSVARNRMRYSLASRSKAEVIYNGVDTAALNLASDQEKTRRTRAQLRLPASAPVVLAVGRLSSVKSHATLIPMMERLLNTVPDAVLLIAGEGPARATLEPLIRRSGLHDHVHLLGLRLDVPVLMKMADVFVLPSLSEGFSVTLLEAMASGLPAVASDIPPNREALSNGAVGKLAPVGNARALADEVASVLKSDGLAQRMSRQGYEKVKSSFDVQRTAERTAALYARLSRTA